MKKLNNLILTGCMAVFVAASQNTYAQATVKAHGAVTWDKMLTAAKAAIESQAGVKLVTVGNGSGRGLSDLSGGIADIGLIGGSLKGVADATNKEKPGSVNADALKEFPITSIKLAIVTHPGVGVKSLTHAQVKDVFTGKATNWKEVGGPDLPIKLVLPFLGDGARISLAEDVLKDAEFSKTAVVRNSAKDIPVVVSQLAGAVSILTVKNVESSMGVIATEKDILMPMSLITKGEPSGDIKKVLDAVKANVK